MANSSSSRDIIVLEGISKTFRIPHQRWDTAREYVVNFWRRRTYTELNVLKNLNLTVQSGEFFGIVGRNGSGKSTLLRILTGIYLPDAGRVTVQGKIAPFLELGIGFNPDLTAKENVYLNGVILGLTIRQVQQLEQQIFEFAELTEFKHMPVKNFSSGMQVRLAFSVAIQAKRELLALDEVLAVGDENFRIKCLETFKQFKREGKTILFVSHDLDLVEEFCDRVLVLEQGEACFVGETRTALSTYRELL